MRDSSAEQGIRTPSLLISDRIEYYYYNICFRRSSPARLSSACPWARVVSPRWGLSSDHRSRPPPCRARCTSLQIGRLWVRSPLRSLVHSAESPPSLVTPVRTFERRAQEVWSSPCGQQRGSNAQPSAIGRGSSALCAVVYGRFNTIRHSLLAPGESGAGASVACRRNQKAGRSNLVAVTPMRWKQALWPSASAALGIEEMFPPKGQPRITRSPAPIGESLALGERPSLFTSLVPFSGNLSRTCVRIHEDTRGFKRFHARSGANRGSRCPIIRPLVQVQNPEACGGGVIHRCVATQAWELPY